MHISSVCGVNRILYYIIANFCLKLIRKFNIFQLINLKFCSLLYAVYSLFYKNIVPITIKESNSHCRKIMF